MDITRAVQNLYERYPFPPDPVSAAPPPGWNWRWSYSFAHSFCLGARPEPRGDLRILDAGCGTGVGTEYLAYLNPEATVVAVDLSEASLAIARRRCTKFANVQFQQLSLTDLDQLPGQFDLINCVGVLHHLADPTAGIRALAAKLAPGGLLHIFVYGELGRWEIRLMQEAIRLLAQPDDRLGDGLKVGRALFEALPDNNRIKQADQRWILENHNDACFVDMYLQVQEVRYTIPTLFDLIGASGLKFLGFSNPDFWQIDRLVGRVPWLGERAASLGEQERYRLIELLDPVVAHYEFFLGRPPLERTVWSDAAIEAALPFRCPYIHPWPEKQVFDHEFRVVDLTDAEFAFLERSDGRLPVFQIRGEVSLERIRELLGHFLLQLSPSSTMRA
ncbi:class I SAM-dependent methyltransferase [Gloeobacter kilaueensis]|uniref:Ubiquinone/menaquinone biosynthesis methyltransferase n=1 Tax=Gloeobacter kilaueensis (strain ATCC BAA-2537 / CCAP 1431/1 / ULC 316 / JS1) TaxID=1183438 RepID=U5QNL8_GLOK1|nr:class I SAM-dependent methyltransferase [Gloeobacter kilaueensis]AGY60521.1 ubiquinone/menaquinone biosynthesis methyltransferase [Gloeobacter kilaueensis JS1]